MEPAKATLRVEVVAEPGAALTGEVGDYLAGLGPEDGVCGEHDPRWLRVFRDALGQRPYMVIARDEGGVMRGYLPLAKVASPLFGRFLVSLPYLNRAGVAAQTPEAAAALIDAAAVLAEQLNVQYMELRHGEPICHPKLTRTREDKQLMVMDLPTSSETLWKDLDPKVRNQVRKGDKHELSIRWGGPELLEAFYEVFAINMRDLGTPVYPRKLFARILQLFAGEAELALVEMQGKAIAGALLTHQKLDNGRTQVPSASSLREYNSTCANMWMYYRLLERAVERGSVTFDFGRSSEGSGTYRFKKQWGAQPRRTVWQYHLRRGELDAMRPDSPKNQRRVAVWQKLPVWLTRLIGPAIVKGIP